MSASQERKFTIKSPKLKYIGSEEDILALNRHTRNKTSDFENFTSNLTNKKPTYKLVKNIFSTSSTPVKVEGNLTEKQLKLSRSNFKVEEGFYKEGKCRKDNCNNWKTLVKYETLIKELNKENERLKQINSFFLIHMGLKDDYILKLINKNSSLCNEMNNAGIKSEIKMPKEIPRGKSYKEIKEIKEIKEMKEMKEKKEMKPKFVLEKNEIRELTVSSKKTTALDLFHVKEEEKPKDTNQQNFNFMNQSSNITNSVNTANNPINNETNTIIDNPPLVSKIKSPFSKTKAKRSASMVIKTLSIKTLPVSEAAEESPEGPKKAYNSQLITGIVHNTLVKNNIMSKEALEKRRTTGSSFLNSTKKRNKSNSHYDKILSFFNNKSKRDSIHEARSSFLVVNNNVLNKIMQQDTVKEILKLTKDDDEFINAMRTFSEDKLVILSDSISTLIRDYEYSLNLIKRIKTFLHVSVRVVNTWILEDAVNMLIKNSCEIMDCERTSIYVHDKITNKLVIHAGEGLQKGVWKIPTDKGIVGYVFTTGEKQKIDDAYLDERFNREVDKKTGYRTKSMLCVALKDENGISFGVIQALNKKNGLLFSNDDEELIEIFSGQASSILKNSMKFDENFSFISRLKRLVNYSIHVHTCKNLFEFTSMTEKVLAGFWSTNISQILIYDEECGIFRHHYAEGLFRTQQSNIGLIGHILKKRELIAINSSYDNHYYNNIIDLETGFPLVTFPIFEFKNESRIIAIAQLGYPFKVIQKTKTIKEIDLDVLNLMASVSSLWLTRFFNQNNQEK